MDYGYKDRVKRECRELGINTCRLDVFIRSPMFEALPEEEQERLVDQQFHMGQYHIILIKRIKWFEKDGDKNEY